MIDIQNMLAAAVPFKPMTDIPFLTDSLSGGGGATEMFNALFTLSITIGAMLAVFMFIFGGLQMITARDSAGGIGEGRKKMSNAVMGLLMLISTFVVLNTINPQLTSLTLFKSADGSDLSRLEAPQRTSRPQSTELKKQIETRDILLSKDTSIAATKRREELERLIAKKITVISIAPGWYYSEGGRGVCVQEITRQGLSNPESRCDRTTQISAYDSVTKDGPFALSTSSVEKYADREACDYIAETKSLSGLATKCITITP